MIERGLVEFILRNSSKFEWSLQGLGMLRLYITPDIRLHVWSDAHRVRGVSDIHTHRWDFQSEVVAGQVRNLRFQEGAGEKYKRQLIHCGPGGCLLGSPDLIKLVVATDEIYQPGEKYNQLAQEIHKSIPTDGTVTLVRRKFKSEKDCAHVFWHTSDEFVSAEPRTATFEEIRSITQLSLDLWFGKDS